MGGHFPHAPSLGPLGKSQRGCTGKGHPYGVHAEGFQWERASKITFFRREQLLAGPAGDFLTAGEKGGEKTPKQSA